MVLGQILLLAALQPGRVPCPEGTERAWWPEEVGIAEGCELPDGTRHGPFVVWQASEQRPRMKGRYRDGRRDGELWYWYASGSAQRVMRYEDGVASGVAMAWRESGELSAETHFRNGWVIQARTWHPDGSRASEVSCLDAVEHGCLVYQEKRWDPNGALRHARTLPRRGPW